MDALIAMGMGMGLELGAISEGEWSSLGGGMYATTEEADFMAQLLSNCPPCTVPDHELDGIHPCTFWAASSDNIAKSTTNSSYSFSQGSSYSAGSSILFPSSSQESYYLQPTDNISQPIFVANNNSSVSMDFTMEDTTNTSAYLVQGDDCLSQEMDMDNVLPKRESDVPQRPEPMAPEKKCTNISENSKKRSRTSGDHVQKNSRRNARSKKNQSSTVSTTKKDELDGNGGLNGPSSASCSSEDDSNGSQELNGGVISSSSKGEAAAKTRANRGAATDPQSLYARKRRERINDRLRILQNLVPNGTKVDISTMLEEAVQYVKFLQLQIKLLSSDDLWMYAPIAYNGMDIGLDLLNVATPKRSKDDAMMVA